MFEWLESLAIDAAEAKAAAEARVPGDHPFLADHFPGRPLLPGSLQIELCAQVAGPLVEELVAHRDGAARFAFLGMVRNATFHAPVALPATLADLRARGARRAGQRRRPRGAARTRSTPSIAGSSWSW